MIGSDTFATVLGMAPAGDPERLTNIVRAMVRNGLSPVLLKPGEKVPACILTETAAKKADQEAQTVALAEHPDRPVDRIRHPCGFAHVIDDPAKVKAIMDRWLTRYGGANLGVHLGRSRLIAVDADYPSEVTAFEREWFQHNHPGLAGRGGPGMTVRSPGTTKPDGTPDHHDGGHWIFTVPDDFPFPPGKGGRALAGYDIKYGDSYVLVPPSVRAEGPYELVGASYPAPMWLLELILALHSQIEKSGRGGYSGDSSSIQAQFGRRVPLIEHMTAAGWTPAGDHMNCGCERWNAPGKTSGTGVLHTTDCALLENREGHGLLKIFSTDPPQGLPSEGAVTAWQFAVSQRFGGNEDALRSAYLMPARGMELMTDLRLALQPAASPVFNGPGADVASPLPVSEGRVLDAMYDSNDLNQIVRPEPLITGVLDVATISVLAGKFGTYKTFVALDWAASIATGRPWFGHEVPTAQPVLYVAAEGSAGLRGRLQAWTARYGPIPRGALTVITVAARLMDPTELAQLGEAMRRTGASQLFIDTLHRSTPGKDENSNNDMGQVIAVVDHVREQFGAGVTLVHHTGHGGERSRGGSSIEDDADASFVIKLKSDNEDRSADNPRVLHHRKAKDAELIDPLELTFHAVDGTPSGVLSADPLLHAYQGLSPAELLVKLEQAGAPANLGRPALEQWVKDQGLNVSQRSMKDALKIRKG